MMFNNGYSHSMDRDYLVSSDNSSEAESTSDAKPREAVLGVKEIGQTVIDGPNAGRFTQSVQAAIRGGAGMLELTPIPSGRGMGGGEVEAYGKEERKEIKELAKINEVELTSVHVPVQTVSNLSGLNMQQGSFSEHQRYAAMEEIKKHIDFAADTVDGGGLVVHTGEFPRTISTAKWNKDVSGQKLFEGFPGEEREAVWHLVDSKTGKIVQSVKEDEEIWRPKIREINDVKQYVKDSEGNEVRDPITGEKIPDFEYDKDGNIKIERETYDEFRERFKQEKPQLAKDPAKIAMGFFREQQMAQIQHHIGQAKEYELTYVEGLKRRDKILKALDFYKEALKNVPEEKRWKYKRPVGDPRLPSDMIPPDYIDPIQFLEDQFKENERRIAYGREIAVSGLRQAHEMEKKIETIKPIGDFALNKSVNTLAEVGVYAMRESSAKKTKKDLYVAPENMMPEMGYGAHPEEMIELVTKAREKMVERLTSERIPDPAGRVDDDGKPMLIKNPDFNPGMSKMQAQEEAKSHIRSTFDTAHLGVWYKHFKPKPGENEEQRQKRFKKWYMNSVKKMAEKEIVGHVHVVDSFGRGDPHLVAGRGMLPVIEAVEHLKSKGVSSFLSEAFEDMREQMTGTWEAFGSPIYSLTRSAAPVRFGDVQHSYFGHAVPPNNVFGAYSPSEDWTLWSQVPFE